MNRPEDPRPLAVVSDFDGTIVSADVGDTICERLVPDAFAAFQRDWREGRVTLVEGQTRIWSRVRAAEADLLSVAAEAGRLRAGFERFLTRLAARGTPFVIASNGFANYVEHLVAAQRGAIRAIYANRLVFDGDRVVPAFPFIERFGCGACGVCKGLVVEAIKAEGYRVAFIGDGASDRCAAGRADVLFATRGGTFERHIAALGLACRTFESFDEIAEALGL